MRLIIILFFCSLHTLAQKPITYKNGNLGFHVYPVKYKFENKSLWISFHSNTKLENPQGMYIDCKISLREQKRKVIYYNLFLRYYVKRDYGIYGQLRIKI